MNIKEAVGSVLADYPNAMLGPLKQSPIAQTLRQDFPDAVRHVVKSVGDYLVEGSPGKGQWNFSPWLAIFDPLITETAQRGYYPVYLFREDFAGVYLSLNQGVTEIRSKYKGNAKDALKARAVDFRARLGELPAGFSSEAIDLVPSASANKSAFYEAGNICSIYYSATNLPADADFALDLARILAAYASLSDADPDLGLSPIEGDEPSGDPFNEDHTRLRSHKRLERNPKVAKKVKEVQGLICKACGFDFRAFYPGIVNHEYIEAHHLIPISQLKGHKVKRDPKTDFAVLCANCHRMIHRYVEPWNLDAFKSTLKSSKTDI